MPRKGSSYQYYDEDYDYYYDDYEDEEEEEEQQQQRASASAGSKSQERKWACSVCTFDNVEPLQACEMCGVFRHSEVPFKFDTPSPDDKVGTKQGNSQKQQKGVELQKPPKPPAEAQNQVEVQNASKSVESQNPAKPVPEAQRKAEVQQAAVPADGQKPAKPPVDTQNAKLKDAMSNLSLENSDSYKTKYKGLPLESYKPEPWMLQGTKGNEKQVLHLVVVGHVDAGKSTLMGRVLHTVGRVSQKEMHKNQKSANEMGKGSFAYAWALDEGSEERARGVTITVAVAHFETSRLRIVLLDAPGHKDFVPNMISGAAQADVAVLVVDASDGGFEAGMKGDGRDNGQTREHAQLVRSLGVGQLLVAVNKMDTVDYSQDRFEEIRNSLAPFLRQCGYRDSAVSWVPVSAFAGENLSNSPTNELFSSWYKGPTFLNALDKFEPPPRDVAKPFRLAIAEVIRTRTATGVGGKVEAGAIKIGSKVMVMPCREIAVVKSLEHDGQSRQIARAGDSVDIGLQGVDAGMLVPGGLLCHPDYLSPVATKLELRILTLKLSIPLLRGSQVVLYVHHAKEAATVTDLTCLLDAKTGETIKRSPRSLASNQSAVVEVFLDREICVEEYVKFRSLGRVVLRNGGNTLAVGIITRVA